MDDEVNFKQGEREAEDMIVEAYAALLLAFLSTERYLPIFLLDKQGICKLKSHCNTILTSLWDFTC